MSEKQLLIDQLQTINKNTIELIYNENDLWPISIPSFIGDMLRNNPIAGNTRLSDYVKKLPNEKLFSFVPIPNDDEHLLEKKIAFDSILNEYRKTDSFNEHPHHILMNEHHDKLAKWFADNFFVRDAIDQFQKNALRSWLQESLSLKNQGQLELTALIHGYNQSIIDWYIKTSATIMHFEKWLLSQKPMPLNIHSDQKSCIFKKNKWNSRLVMQTEHQLSITADIHAKRYYISLGKIDTSFSPVTDDKHLENAKYQLIQASCDNDALYDMITTEKEYDAKDYPVLLFNLAKNNKIYADLENNNPISNKEKIDFLISLAEQFSIPCDLSGLDFSDVDDNDFLVDAFRQNPHQSFVYICDYNNTKIIRKTTPKELYRVFIAIWNQRSDKDVVSKLIDELDKKKSLGEKLLTVLEYAKQYPDSQVATVWKQTLTADLLEQHDSSHNNITEENESSSSESMRSAAVATATTVTSVGISTFHPVLAEAIKKYQPLVQIKEKNEPFSFIQSYFRNLKNSDLEKYVINLKKQELILLIQQAYGLSDQFNEIKIQNDLTKNFPILLNTFQHWDEHATSAEDKSLLATKLLFLSHFESNEAMPFQFSSKNENVIQEMVVHQWLQHILSQENKVVIQIPEAIKPILYTFMQYSEGGILDFGSFAIFHHTLSPHKSFGKFMEDNQFVFLGKNFKWHVENQNEQLVIKISVDVIAQNTSDSKKSLSFGTVSYDLAVTPPHLTILNNTFKCENEKLAELFNLPGKQAASDDDYHQVQYELLKDAGADLDLQIRFFDALKKPINLSKIGFHHVMALARSGALTKDTLITFGNSKGYCTIEKFYQTFCRQYYNLRKSEIAAGWAPQFFAEKFKSDFIASKLKGNKFEGDEFTAENVAKILEHAIDKLKSRTHEALLQTLMDVSTTAPSPSFWPSRSNTPEPPNTPREQLHSQNNDDNTNRDASTASLASSFSRKK